jgi:hypothetical protein
MDSSHLISSLKAAEPSLTETYIWFINEYKYLKSIKEIFCIVHTNKGVFSPPLKPSASGESISRISNLELNIGQRSLLPPPTS